VHNASQAPQDVWLGIDVGTQSVRALAVSDAGRLLALGSHPLTSRRDGERRHEQDPEQWWRAVAAACRALVQQLPASRIRALAVDATSGTVLLADQDTRSLTPALMYDDARAAAEAQLVRDVSAETLPPLASWARPSWSLPKLLWLLREYRNIAPGARLLHQSDFVNSRLAGHPVACDWSNAFKSGYDLAAKAWHPALFAALAIPEPIMPEVVPPGTQLATVCAQAASETGIPAATPIVAGMSDACAAQIASGALDVGDWNSVLGTTLALKGVTRQLIQDPAGVLYSHRSPDGCWLPGGACNVGAGALARHFPGEDLNRFTAEAAARGPATVTLYPLPGRGERFPFFAPNAEEFTLGEPRDEVDLFSGILQGVAFVERLCFDYLDLLGAPLHGSLSFTGGATRNRYWNQLRADVLGRRVRIPQNPEPALGMAILAAAAPREPLAVVAQRMSRTRERIEPSAGGSSSFHAPYLRFVAELERRGWLPAPLAQHAAARIGRPLAAAVNHP
jgi:sugar (pentulose or hexulose) kinase